MSKLIQEIKRKYPNPITAAEANRRYREKDYDSRADLYCVGGAFCQFVADKLTSEELSLRIRGNFPLVHTLIDAIACVLPTLDKDRRIDAAKEVIFLNDQGMFDAAWKVLEDLFDEGESNEEGSSKSTC